MKSFKRPAIRVKESPAGRLAFIGDTCEVGTYVLRIRVEQPTVVQFGKKSGRAPIELRPGDYSYVGSALGGLANRLLRHSSRTGQKPPHPIRELMLSEFRRLKWRTSASPPPGAKHFHWNVDDLLESPSSRLIGAILIRSPRRIEQAVGRLLEHDDTTVVFEPGLGAAEFHGLTFLLRVDADENWWELLPARLADLVVVEELRSRYPSLVEGLIADRRLSIKQMITVANVRHERAEFILRRMVNDGLSFVAADRASQEHGVFDTHDFEEVASRLRRLRGYIRKAVAAIRANASLVEPDEQRKAIDMRAKMIKTDVRGLRRALSAASRGQKTPPIEKPPSLRPFDDYKVNAVSYNAVVGWLNLRVRFLEKSVRDMPLMRTKGLGEPTATQRSLIRWELAQIEDAAEIVQKLCDA